MEPRRRVHPLVHVTLLDVQMAIEMDDPDAAVDVWRDGADVRVSDRVVAAEDDREDALGDDERDGTVDLVKALLEVRRDDEDVAEVDEVQLLLEVDRHVDGVGVVQRRDPADCLRPEAAAGAVGRAHVEWGAEDGDLVLADLVHVLDVRSLPEGVDAGEGRLLPPGEGRDRPVLHGWRRFEAVLERPLDGLALLTVRDLGERPDVPHAPKRRAVPSPGVLGQRSSSRSVL